jgi:histidine phosphotransferase ChpT
MAGEGLGLAQAVCTRLCHDLGGAVGALAGALEMIGDAPTDATELAHDAARIIERRLRFWRVAAGGPSDAMDAAALAELGEGLTLGRRASLDLQGLEPGLIPPEMAQPLLLAMLIGIEALPRGGLLHVAGSAEGGFTILPEGPGASWPPGLPSVVAGRPPADLAPRGIALPLLGAVAEACRVRLDLAMGLGGAPSPLMLTLAR